MNKVLLAAAVALLATPALAQNPAGTLGGGRTQGTEANTPSYQEGSGQRAGGPAQELNRTPGPVVISPNDPAASLPGGRAQGVGAGDTGSGQTAGGPANDLNRSGTGPATTGTILNDPASNLGGGRTQGTEATTPSYQQGSGQRAGGPAGELNRQ